ncbi:MAG TPA: hypothetical protein VFO70_07200 [Chitinophagaceae bacterium]|nr:hypothetical protein [Chitinophagaceae bacterium]
MKNLILLLALSFAIIRCNKDEDSPLPQAIVIKGSGNIADELDQFRNLLGSVLNTTPGQTSGRREINWDGVPDAFVNQQLPHDFFNPTDAGSSPSLQRGLLYSPEVDARISNMVFADREASHAAEFAPFSGNKTFSAVSSNLWNVEFEVAGQRVAAAVHGFGAVFSDVDEAASTNIEYFSGNRSLGVYAVPVRSTGSHSFLGVYFPVVKVTRVRIMQGNAALENGVKDISSGGTKDLVIMDDFLYDEPTMLQ